MSHLLGMGSLGDIRETLVVGEAFEVGDRTIYPVVRVLTFGGTMVNLYGARISPLAIVMEEPTQKYVVALTDEKLPSDQFLEMVISSKDEGSRKRK